MSFWFLIALLGPISIIFLILELMTYDMRDWRKYRFEIYSRIFYLIYAGVAVYFSIIFFIHAFSGGFL